MGHAVSKCQTWVVSQVKQTLELIFLLIDSTAFSFFFFESGIQNCSALGLVA
jgi:hypothetical protein